MFKKSALLFALVAFAVSGAFAQETQMRKLAPGQKYKLKGFVVAKDDSSFVLRDAVGVDTTIQFDQTTSIRTKGGFLRSGDKVAATQIIRGLNIEAEGRGNANGGLDAAKLRFDEGDLRTALSIDTRVAPAEDRITEAEQNAQRLSGQIDELMEVSNTIRGETRVAQDTAEAAVTGVNATNQRISTLDDFVIQSTATVNFRVNSFVLSPEAKAQLDQVARSVMMLRGYTIEVTGFASAEGNAQRNRVLSENRAQAVINYLVENHNIDLRRFTQSYGFGANRPVADNSSREGREQNRRVEVRVLVNKGLNQNVEVRTGQ